MRGSVKRSGSGWGFVVDLGVDPMTGKRRQLRRRGFRTEKIASAQLVNVLADVGRGQFVRPTKGTLGQFLIDKWLPVRRLDLRPSSVHGYQKVIVGRIVPMLGHVPLSALDVATVEAFYGRLLSSGGRTGVPYRRRRWRTLLACSLGSQ